MNKTINFILAGICLIVLAIIAVVSLFFVGKLIDIPVPLSYYFGVPVIGIGGGVLCFIERRKHVLVTDS